MARTLILTDPARRLVRRLTPASSEARQVLAVLFSQLTEQDLPAPADDLTRLPPASVPIWFRRLRGHNLWVLFSFTDETVMVRSVVPLPPVPYRKPADEPDPESDPEPAQ